MVTYFTESNKGHMTRETYLSARLKKIQLKVFPSKVQTATQFEVHGEANLFRDRWLHELPHL